MLRSGTVGDDHLAEQAPGVVMEFSSEDWTMQRRVMLRHPGFVVNTCEKAATTWFWDGKARAFRSLTTGD
jgi:hypothetical protein